LLTGNVKNWEKTILQFFTCLEGALVDGGWPGLHTRGVVAPASRCRSSVSLLIVKSSQGFQRWPV
jgi:hypothetical protein